MKLNIRELQQMDRVKRLKLINAVSGVKPANLIGTKSKNGKENLAIFSSVVHLGSDPPMLGFILRPTGEVPRHTYENLLENGCYTINHVHSGITANAHYTSAKFTDGESEFERCGLTPEYLDGFNAPFVAESRVKIGMEYESEYVLPNLTRLVVGRITHLILPENAFDDRDELDLEMLDSLGTGGLNRYYQLKQKDWFPYARVSELPSGL